MTTSRTSRLAALAATTALSVAGLAAVPATGHAAPDARGTASIAELLAADGLEFDSDWDDFDIVDQAVATVLDAEPGSAVAVLADGSTKLTVFAPTDRAFRRLVADTTGDRPGDEQATFDAVATLGVDTIEQVLLYHVVPGKPITYFRAKQADGARLETAEGSHLKVRVRPRSGQVFLRDADRNDRNARVITELKNLNKGNRQIAHGISEVLRPADL